jgi:hypothetical protein
LLFALLELSKKQKRKINPFGVIELKGKTVGGVAGA